MEPTPPNQPRQTGQRETPEEEEGRRQLFQQQTRYRTQQLSAEARAEGRRVYQQQAAQLRLERQIQRENQTPITVRLPTSNSSTTLPSTAAGTSRTPPRQRRRTNETPQSFS